MDPVLQNGTTVLRRNGEPVKGSGAFAVVYVIKAGNKSHGLRCWTAGVDDSAQHYATLREYLRPRRLPYFVDFEYLSDGIYVPEKGKLYPTLRMEWVTGQTLRDFISASLGDRATLLAAAEGFLQMVHTLHTHRISHGDLQTGNILVQQGGSKLVLIDYDTLFIPPFDGKPVVNLGLAGYQHPRRALSRTASTKDDYFSELVIYLTLLAVAENPQLWEEFGLEDETDLLFHGDDFLAELPTPIFQALSQLSLPVSQLSQVLWNFTRCQDIQGLKPLEEVVELVNKIQPRYLKPSRPYQALAVQRQVDSPRQLAQPGALESSVRLQVVIRSVCLACGTLFVLIGLFCYVMGGVITLINILSLISKTFFSPF